MSPTRDGQRRDRGPYPQRHGPRQNSAPSLHFPWGHLAAVVLLPSSRLVRSCLGGFVGTGLSLNPPLWTLRHSGSPKISSSSRTTSVEVTGPQNPTAMAGSGKLLWCRARWDLPTFPGQRRAEVDGFMPGGSWPPALPGSPHQGHGDTVVALTAQRSGGCCPHGPSDGGSSQRGLPGDNRLWRG